jgi:hypothetical protein
MALKSAVHRSSPTKRSDNIRRQKKAIQRQALKGGSAANSAEMQKRLGNQGTQAWLVQQQIQTKLTIGQPGDKYEQEADRTADTVMRMPDPMKPGDDGIKVQTKPLAGEQQQIRTVQTIPNPDSPHIQRLCTECEKELSGQPEKKWVQRKEHNNQTPQVTPDIEADIAALNGNGSPLPNSTRNYFEPRFGADFSQVRVHTGTQAAETAKSLNAKAFTVGNNIVFSQGQFAPNSHEGQRLMGHELTHVVQQNSPARHTLSHIHGSMIQYQPASAGSRKATIQVRWIDDDVSFYHRVVNAIAVSPDFRGVPKAGLWQPFHDPIFDLFRRLSSQLSAGDSLQLRVSAWFDPTVFHGQVTSASVETEQEGRLRETRELVDIFELAVIAKNWEKTALLLNAFFSDDEILSLLKGLTKSDLIEVRRGALKSMPGWSDRVTTPIDTLYPDAARIGLYSDNYEAAMKAKDWETAALLLNGFSDADILAKLDKLSNPDLVAMKRGAQKSMPGWSDRVVNPVEKLLSAKARPISPGEQSLLDRLEKLGVAAKAEGTEGADFKKAVDEFKTTLRVRMQSLNPGDALPIDVDLIMKALMLWSTDPGNKWGEGSWDSNDLVMSAPDYAIVPASQYKCNAYVAEVIYQSLGKVYRIHPQVDYVFKTGKYFPYRAGEWGDVNQVIDKFPVISSPVMGDMWSNGLHTGIYLGEYAGKKLYLSARDDGSGVFGLKANVQREHGVQVKYLPDGGVFRRYTP